MRGTVPTEHLDDYSVFHNGKWEHERLACVPFGSALVSYVNRTLSRHLKDGVLKVEQKSLTLGTRPRASPSLEGGIYTFYTKLPSCREMLYMYVAWEGSLATQPKFKKLV